MGSTVNPPADPVFEAATRAELPIPAYPIALLRCGHWFVAGPANASHPIPWPPLESCPRCAAPRTVVARGYVGGQ